MFIVQNKNMDKMFVSNLEDKEIYHNKPQDTESIRNDAQTGEHVCASGTDSQESASQNGFKTQNL